jgi:hypothetical protein
MSVRVAGCWVVLVLGTGVVLAGAPQRAEGQVKAPGAIDLSGRWRFNKELSDDEAAKLRPAAKAERPPADTAPSGEAEEQGAERGGRGAGPGARTGHATPPQGVDENDPRGAKQTTGPPATLAITQVESEIRIEETPGQTRSLYPNGVTYKTDEGATQIRTSWKEGRLVVERKNVRGWRLVETWALAADRGRLVVTMLLEGGSQPKVSVKRVYDREEAAPPEVIR